MPRKMRVQYPGALDHVISRGDQRASHNWDLNENRKNIWLTLVMRRLFGSVTAYLVFAAIGLLLFCGCDPVRTTSQRITLAVNDGRGLPVPDAKVRIKESWESWRPEGFKEAEKDFYLERWQSDYVPWIEGLANAEGKVVLESVVTAIDGTRGSEPPAKRDWVSNREYIVKLQTKDTEEELTILMTPGAISKGQRYTVRIERIEKPRYVKGQ